MIKKKGQLPLTIGAGFFLLLFSSCKVEPPKPPLVETVAILLFDSESNNVDAPDIMRRLVYLALVNSPYRVSDLDSVQATLNKAGIVDGGQLAAVDPVKVGRDLGVQAVLFGNVETFKYTNIGFYFDRKVVLELKLVSVDTGETLWEQMGKAATRNLTLDSDEAKKNLAKGLADQLVDKLFNTPLEAEAKLATRRALRTLPGFRFRGFAKDKHTPGALKKGSKGVIKEIIKNK